MKLQQRKKEGSRLQLHLFRENHRKSSAIGGNMEITGDSVQA